MNDLPGLFRQPDPVHLSCSAVPVNHQTDSAQCCYMSVPVNQVVHPLVACDVCDRPIVGVRYKCG